MAKNKIKRSLLAIIDPYPSKTELDSLWSYFQSSCAYCGVSMHRDSRTGHADHLHSSALGGSNSIYNHVLSCARCNGDEKREEAWETFLNRKVLDIETAQERHARISQWIARGLAAEDCAPRIRDEAYAIVDQALKSFDAAVAEMRKLRDGLADARKQTPEVTDTSRLLANNRD